FFFKVTLKRLDLAEEVVSTREPRRLPVVLSPEEVGRLLASAINIKHKALLSLAYATGLRASEVVSLKLTDIDSDRMVIRVEQGKSLPSRRRGARRIGMSLSRPTCSRYCANGGASRVECKVRAHPIVVGGVIRQQMAEVPFPQHHDMVEALASDRANQPFDMTVLPRRVWRDRPVANAHGSQPSGDRGAIRGVAVTDEVARCLIPW